MSSQEPHLRVDDLASNHGVVVENPPPVQRVLDPTPDLLEDEFFPLSGKPYFHVVLSKSNVRPLYLMGIPVKIQQILPCTKIPTVLSYQGKKWKMLYNGKNVKHKRFDGSWRTFVNDNKLKVGDACVFELMEKSEKGLNFRVQILRGDIPSKFLNMVNGESINAPIMIGLVDEDFVCKENRTNHTIYVLRQDDKGAYDFSLFKTDKEACIKWLDDKPNGSVVYVYTIEVLSLGASAIAVLHMTDQSTNAKFIIDVWEKGIRASVDEKGIVRRHAIENFA